MNNDKDAIDEHRKTDIGHAFGISAEPRALIARTKARWNPQERNPRRLHSWARARGKAAARTRIVA